MYLSNVVFIIMNVRNRHQPNLRIGWNWQWKIIDWNTHTQEAKSRSKSKRQHIVHILLCNSFFVFFSWTTTTPSMWHFNEDRKRGKRIRAALNMKRSINKDCNYTYGCKFLKHIKCHFNIEISIRCTFYSFRRNHSGRKTKERNKKKTYAPVGSLVGDYNSFN